MKCFGLKYIIRMYEVMCPVLIYQLLILNLRIYPCPSGRETNSFCIVHQWVTDFRVSFRTIIPSFQRTLFLMLN